MSYHATVWYLHIQFEAITGEKAKSKQITHRAPPSNLLAASVHFGASGLL